jgi:hypothetical protein
MEYITRYIIVTEVRIKGQIMIANGDIDYNILIYVLLYNNY